MSRPLRTAALSLFVLLAVAPVAQAAKKTPTSQFFVALGDSYTVGYQDAVGHTTHNGPADQLVPLARKRGYSFKLVNLGCGGATTDSMLTQLGCDAPALAPGASGYAGKTQTQAAVDFIKRHKGKVGLVTISISGNDITPCIPAPDPITCTQTRMKTVRANLGKIVERLRAAGGKHMRIIGSTYPDVVLGAWVRPIPFGDARFTVATNSITAFRDVLNPGLKKTYASVGGAFVDVTRATGAYGNFGTVSTTTYGRIPQPVATVCRLTYFCTSLGIHMTTPGYHIIAELEAARLPRVG
jgi:lysophospholipase L1-like esterase